MSNLVGRFIWYELMTPDPDAVAPFYAAVVGWRVGAAEAGLGPQSWQQWQPWQWWRGHRLGQNG